MAAALVSEHVSPLPPSEFMLVDLFHLAAEARCVTMATTETIVGEMIQELMLLCLCSLNDSPLHQQSTDGSMKRNSIGSTAVSK